ncbi:hypothetical protein HZB01_02295 [Candidatus Woesearchaeota archaeon]|nr:hypothetical protein [Candidatus Woesearchaeota archaeon]
MTWYYTIPSGFAHYDNKVNAFLMAVLTPNISKLSASPIKHEDGSLEYKIECPARNSARGTAEVQHFFDITMTPKGKVGDSPFYEVTGIHGFTKRHHDKRIAALEQRVYDYLKANGDVVADCTTDADGVLHVTYLGLPPEVPLHANEMIKTDELQMAFFRKAIELHAKRYTAMKQAPISDEDLASLRDARWTGKLARAFYGRFLGQQDDASGAQGVEGMPTGFLDDIRTHFDAYRVMHALGFSEADQQFKEVYARLMTAKKKQFLPLFGGITTDEFLGNYAMTYDYSEYAQMDPKFTRNPHHLFLPVTNVKAARFDFDNLARDIEQMDICSLLDDYRADLSRPQYDTLLQYAMQQLGFTSPQEKKAYLNALDFARFERNLFFAGHALKELGEQPKNEEKQHMASHYLQRSTDALGRIVQHPEKYWTQEQITAYKTTHGTTMVGDLRYLQTVIRNHIPTTMISR